MIEPKVSLSLVIPGATMLSSRDCEKMPKDQAYNHFTLEVFDGVKVGKKLTKKPKILHINTRKCRTVKQVLLISKTAYESMINPTAIPSASLTKSWKNMNKKQRLEYHLAEIAEGLKALSFSYTILED